ncbi:MAG: helix-turn-helix transcriptional regulator [Cyclobacteriaceae bacterium]
MTNNSIQSVFLDKVKKSLPSHIAFADDLAEILSISRDSAYRRIRGETILSLDEVSAICKHFRMSLDEIISPSAEIVSFHNRFVTEEDFTFEKWLLSINDNLDMLAGHSEREMIISAKDIPIFYYFKTPELCAFKMFFWMKSILRYGIYNSENFRPELVPRELLALGKRINEKFTRIERTELWSEDTIHASLRQIEFYHDCGFFNSPLQGQHLCDELLNVVMEIKDCAAAGYFTEGNEHFHLFKNEILIADNTFLFKMGNKHAVFINHNTLNVLSTIQESFCRQTETYLRNLLNKATKISGTGEKERLKFFNRIEAKIRNLRQRIS